MPVGPQGAATTTLTIRESARVSWLSLFLGYGAAVPFLAAAAALWTAGSEAAAVVTDAVIVWGSLILAFLAGVRRGLSFRTEQGPTAAQLAVMGWLFCVALACFLLPWGTVSLALQIAAFASLAVLDPVAAARGEAPLFFMRLRPVQMPVIALALTACLMAVTLKGW